MNRSYPSAIEVAVVAYCLFEARSLRWADTPAMHWGWLALLIWCVPIAYHMLHCIRYKLPKGYSPLLLGLAVLTALLGSLSDLNALRHLSLAFGLAGLMPLCWPMLIWLPTAAAWMPAFGYFARYYPLPLINLMEPTLAVIGTTTLLTWQLRRNR